MAAFNYSNLVTSSSTAAAVHHSRQFRTAASLNKNHVSKKERRPENIPGEFFVGATSMGGSSICPPLLRSYHTCIDCDTCRWMAPDIFNRAGNMSAVFKQPSCEDERLKALQALLSCPTSSIRTEKPARDILKVQKTFPIPINAKRIPGVFHCGYHSDKSYGAASYFVVHPQGNILIDSPRYTERLAGNIEKLGGVHYMFLTHKDDIADHDKWFKRFRCNRIMHSKEIGKNTVDVEMKLEGNGPWNFSPDFDIIHTPGHTEGSVCLFYKPLKILFTGDHLSMSEFGLSIGEMYNWYSVPMQLNSVKLLIQLDFEWILPGHGRRAEFKDVADKNSAIESLLAAMLPV